VNNFAVWADGGTETATVPPWVLSYIGPTVRSACTSANGFPAMPKQKRISEPDVSRAINALRRFVRGLRSAAETVEREVKISAAQLFVLNELAQAPDQSVKDLAARTMTTHSTVSEVVAQLIAKGLVSRTSDARDARRSVLRLSKQGSRTVKTAPRAIQEDLIEGFGSLKPSVRRGLASGLEKWLEASGLGRVPSTMLFEKPRDERPPAREKRTAS